MDDNNNCGQTEKCTGQITIILQKKCYSYE